MNRELFPNSVYPITGDVESQAGNPGVSVVGIHNIPVAGTFPVNGDALVFDASTNNWTPGAPAPTTPATHDEPLTDGNGNIIFAATMTMGGDVVVVIGVPN